MIPFKMPGLGGEALPLEFNEETQQYDPLETQADSLIRRFGEEEAKKQLSWPKEPTDEG